MRIFITGASGCIGHYVVDTLIKNSDHELFLMVRNPDRLHLDIGARPGIHCLQGDIREINKFADRLSTVDQLIHIATSWGDPKESYEINVEKTLRLMSLLDPQRLRQVIYFSTSSILGPQNRPLKAAGEIGTDYIRSKYICYQRLGQLAISPQITTLFPTLVFGGDGQKPYSHISGALPEVAQWIGLARFLQAEGSFHYIHAQDIATVVRYLVEHPPAADGPRDIVLGGEAMTVNQAIEETSRYFGQRIYFRLPLSARLTQLLIKVFNVRVAEWDRFCIQHRHFTYQNPVSPAKLGLTNYCSTLADLFRAGDVAPR
ncbi:NAD(P)-dependent oxidoreductase [Romeria aff. gracilis LEGE 07310]|uniref:NAD(P)-dependent oxidoreductase n=1 Tax=Vasconcelosia minhoensis LEGE 07310 TaxID=915328 RepID=A0A8J7DM32_9CYAN|nr:NAD(P)-dependent oxidoreductase [Romeria gracilis]MBE9078186.1 NAD(P)-dependent oxidoreductase [Romeria aff. gracilis LEGE 07310]